MDSQWTGYLPRVGAHDIVSLVNLQRTSTGAAVGRRVDAHAVGQARPRLNSLSSANRITAPFSVLTSEWMAALPSAI